MKYLVFMTTEILVKQLNSHREGNAKNLDDSVISQNIVDKLGEGYEIYKAIPFATENVAGIRYILRKEAN